MEGEKEKGKRHESRNEKGKQGENENCKDEQGLMGSSWIKRMERKSTKREKEGTNQKMEKKKETEEEEREKKGKKWMSKREWSLEKERKGVVEPLVGGEKGGKLKLVVNLKVRCFFYEIYSKR